MGESRRQPIAPHELPDLLTQLDAGRTTDLALLGPEIPLSTSPEDWPEELQGRVLYQLTGHLSRLFRLPRELLRLDRLQILTLWSLGLQDADAAAIAQHLGQLTSLNLHNNQVGDEAVADIGQQLTSLVRLDLRGNERITTIAPLAQLPLSTLNIAETGVADLSPLKSLILAGLPVKSDRWWEGPGIYVEDCLLTHPSPEIVQQGPEAVLNYFREIEAQGLDRLFEAKLLIVGKGGSGKTSLLRRLFLPDLDLPTQDETTRGIDIHRHEFPTSVSRSQGAGQAEKSPNDDGRFRIGTWLQRLLRPAHAPGPGGGHTFRLNTWDFGGQQIYHATHQFFLTRRSLYVLVDDTRSDHRSIHDEGFKFWLEVVETLSEGSPLLIFQNEKGGRSKPIDEAGIKGRFPNVQAIHRGNLEHRCSGRPAWGGGTSPSGCRTSARRCRPNGWRFARIWKTWRGPGHTSHWMSILRSIAVTSNSTRRRR